MIETSEIHVLFCFFLGGRGLRILQNIPLEHTPDPQPLVYEGILFMWGFGDGWGMLQGYVGVLLEGGKLPQFQG